MHLVADSSHEPLIERLRSRERELGRRLRRVQAHRRREHGALDPDSGERAVERENDEVLDGLDASGRKELLELRTALRRYEAGCFGLCDACGEEVDPERLAVSPSASRCLVCAQQREDAIR